MQITFSRNYLMEKAKTGTMKINFKKTFRKESRASLALSCPTIQLQTQQEVASPCYFSYFFITPAGGKDSSLLLPQPY